MLVAGNTSEEVRAQTSRLDAFGNVREESYVRMPLSAADQKYA